LSVRRLRLERFELAVLAVLLSLSVAVLAGLLVRVWRQGGLVTGSDGFLVVDQLQYLNWLRQAGEHMLVENLYDLDDGPRTFLHPGVLVSGLLHAAGLGLVASYMVWKPVAVGALFAGVLLYVRRFLDREGDRRLALVLALFTASPIAAAVGWSVDETSLRKFELDFISNEMWPERGRAAGRARMLAWAAAAGVIAAWLQPWQGITFALVLAAAEGVHVARRERSLREAARDLALPLAATALPLAYYLALSLADPAWELAGEVNDRDRWTWWITVVGLAPLGLPALLGYRLPARDFGQVALRAWPIAGLVVFYQPAGTFPFHAFQGLALPLVVLGVVGVRALLGDRPLPAAAAVAAVALLVVPGTAYNVDQIRDAVNRGFQPHFLTDDEHDALRHLDDLDEEGGVLAPRYMGLLLPAYTGRETWIGAGSWTPDFDRRAELTEDLFAGRMARPEAEALVRRSRARFLLSDCHGRARIDGLVVGVAGPPRRFGCATVYRVRG
jgi:hypothetical protein